MKKNNKLFLTGAGIITLAFLFSCSGPGPSTVVPKQPDNKEVSSVIPKDLIKFGVKSVISTDSSESSQDIDWINIDLVDTANEFIRSYDRAWVERYIEHSQQEFVTT